MDKLRQRINLSFRRANKSRESENPSRRILGRTTDFRVRQGMTRFPACFGGGGMGLAHPPVTLIWRLTLGRLCLRSMMKSWPLGFRPMARSIAALSRSLSDEARSGLRRSEASSWPRQVCSVPVQVIRTRLQDSQKLWVIGGVEPSLPPVSLTPT